MPNIIEQQDLLKNLPDARLATLLQNPVADIPPFLVAAEAQRRQSIRQQFAGSENSESVVDTLTKQIAKVPQNIQSPMQTPPMVPPTPQMQGVAALQQQQAIQDIAQQAQPQQQMRHGGMVQRYQDRGLVQPFRGRAGAGGYTPGEEPYGYGIIPDILGSMNEATAPFLERIKKFGLTPTPAQVEQMKAEEAAIADKASNPPLPPGAASGMSFTPALPKERAENVDPLGGEPPPPPEPGETKDEYRARVEAMFANREPSSWEKAQKWFAMAEKFFDPSLTTGQSIAAAGAAFAGSAGEQARAERELEIAKEKALLDWDISKAEEKKAKASKQTTDKLESMKYQAQAASDEAKMHQDAIATARRELAEYRKNNGGIEGVVDPNDPVVKDLQEQIRVATDAMNAAIRKKQYYEYQYGTAYGTYGVPEYWDSRNPNVVGR